MTGNAGRERWFDRDAGPLVRPYALTKGRTEPATGTALSLIDVVVATAERPLPGFRPGPEHRGILGLCHNPIPVIDVATEVDLPVGVVRVLLGDLITEGLLRIVPASRQPRTDQRLLRMVLDGLEAL